MSIAPSILTLPMTKESPLSKSKMSLHRQYSRWNFLRIIVSIILGVSGGVIRSLFLTMSGFVLFVVASFVMTRFRCPVCRYKIAFAYQSVFGFEGLALLAKLPERCPECDFDLKSEVSVEIQRNEELRCNGDQQCFQCGRLIRPNANKCEQCGWTWIENEPK